MEPYVLIPILVVLLTIAFIVFAAIQGNKRNKRVREIEIQFIKRARSIRPNMTKENVISLLGNRYTTSYLQDGVENLVWQLNKYKNISIGDTYVKQLAYTRKISVSFKNNIAIEVRSFNMD